MSHEALEVPVKAPGPYQPSLCASASLGEAWVGLAGPPQMDEEGVGCKLVKNVRARQLPALITVRVPFYLMSE